ncbi:hypothetical protein HP499_13570 [Paenarthrobacter sp. CM16]|uniref:DUF6308 family protein n=1 Tax=Micrococcaceae TaxID=1268 RepID=UPI0015516B93|nr:MULTISPECIES: DUF6308 family protein [Micrococcaceae]NQD88825.1 hypothetical protein [Paenarthrobacter sp. CM16]BCW57836.1 hypothetical protein StoSoilB20_11830 [Arthrobacter sp. StoSoilB20]
MTLPKILSQSKIDEAAALVGEYYTKLYRNDLPQTGSRFDDWAGGGDKGEVAHIITADDVLAVSFLSVQVTARAAIGLIETHAGEVSELLKRIPTDLDLSAVAPDEYAEVLGSQSPANQLWRLLRGSDSYRWGIGPTTASKVMARKRPRLIPIFDSVVGPLMGHPTCDGQWETWHSVLTDGSGLPERLRMIRRRAAIDHDISDLRTMDVVLWMFGKSQGMAVHQEAG